MNGGETFKKLVLVGASERWEKDVAYARSFPGFKNAPLGVVNGMGVVIEEPIELWASIHGDKLLDWVEQRSHKNLNIPEGNIYGNFDHALNMVALNKIPPYINVYNQPNGGGSSGLFTLKIALELGYNRVILCGMPIAGQQRIQYEGNPEELITAEPSTLGYGVYETGWMRAMKLYNLKEMVRSVSGGYTQELLGRPTKSWAMGYDYPVSNY